MGSFMVSYLDLDGGDHEGAQGESLSCEPGENVLANMVVTQKLTSHHAVIMKGSVT